MLTTTVLMVALTMMMMLLVLLLVLVLLGAHHWCECAACDRSLACHVGASAASVAAGMKTNQTSKMARLGLLDHRQSGRLGECIAGKQRSELGSAKEQIQSAIGGGGTNHFARLVLEFDTIKHQVRSL